MMASTLPLNHRKRKMKLICTFTMEGQRTMFRMREYTGKPLGPWETTKDSDPVQINLIKLLHKGSPCKYPHAAKVESGE